MLIASILAEQPRRRGRGSLRTAHRDTRQTHAHRPIQCRPHRAEVSPDEHVNPAVDGRSAVGGAPHHRPHSARRTARPRARHLHRVVRLEHHAADDHHRSAGHHRVRAALLGGRDRSRRWQSRGRCGHGAARGAGPADGCTPDAPDPSTIRFAGQPARGGARRLHVSGILRVERGARRQSLRRSDRAAGQLGDLHHRCHQRRRDDDRLQADSLHGGCAVGGRGPGAPPRVRLDDRCQWVADGYLAQQRVHLGRLHGHVLRSGVVADRLRALRVGLHALSAARHRSEDGLLGNLCGMCSRVGTSDAARCADRRRSARLRHPRGHGNVDPWDLHGAVPRLRRRYQRHQRHEPLLWRALHDHSGTEHLSSMASTGDEPCSHRARAVRHRDAACSAQCRRLPGQLRQLLGPAPLRPDSLDRSQSRRLLPPSPRRVRHRIIVPS